jgi:lysyl-tRNA synthetase class I
MGVEVLCIVDDLDAIRQVSDQSLLDELAHRHVSVPFGLITDTTEAIRSAFYRRDANALETILVRMEREAKEARFS